MTGMASCADWGSALVDVAELTAIRQDRRNLGIGPVLIGGKVEMLKATPGMVGGGTKGVKGFLGTTDDTAGLSPVLVGARWRWLCPGMEAMCQSPWNGGNSSTA